MLKVIVWNYKQHTPPGIAFRVSEQRSPQRRVGLPTNGLITIKPRLLCSENRTNEELKALDVQHSEVAKRMLSVKGDCGSPGRASALRESGMWFYGLKWVADNSRLTIAGSESAN